MSDALSPPRLARALLRACAPWREREHVEGDLEEGFERRWQAESPRAARRWYRVEVLRSLWPLLTFPGRWRGMTMVGWVQDLRGALRVFGRSPGFAGVVVLTLGLGVGGTAAVYSVVRGVLVTPLPFDDPDRVVMLWGQSQAYPRAPLTVGDHNALVADVEAFEGVAAAWSNSALLLGEGGAEQVSVGWVTPEYFDVVGVRPELGRLPGHADEQGVVIAHGLWVRRWGADPAVVGRTIDLDGVAFEIAGVLPADRDPNLTTFSTARADHELWRLMPPDWVRGDDRSVGWLRSTARLRDDVSLEQAQAETDAVMAAVNLTVTDRDGGADMRVRLVPVKADLVGGVSRTLWTLLAAVCAVLLIAASNVAQLLLARGEHRSAEVAVRAALGGSRARLARQLLTESAVLAAAGGLLGFGLASVGVRLLVAIAPPTLPRLELVRLDGAVLLFAVSATAAAAVFFGLVPALRGSRVDLSRALGERGGTPSISRQRLSRMLIVAEVAVSVALVAATGLLLRSSAGLAAEELGFRPEGVLTFSIQAPGWGETDEEAAARIRAYLDRIEQVPGVEVAGMTNRIPLAGGLYTGTVRSAEMVAAEAEPMETAIRWITPGYLEALGARIVAGRPLAPEDGLQQLLVDEVAARILWPDGTAVGRRLEMSAIGSDPVTAEVVGVLAAMKHDGVAEAAQATIWAPMLATARNQNFRYVAARTSGPPAEAVEPLRAAVREVDGDAVLARVRPMEDLVEADVAATRFATFLLTTFGAVALLLASVGLHGVMAYSMRRRTREFGIRVVLGASRAEIIGDSLRSGGALVAGGVALGLVLALGAGELVEALLFGVAPRDVPTLVGASASVALVGLASAYLPARIVLGVDPAVALREE